MPSKRLLRFGIAFVVAITAAQTYGQAAADELSLSRSDGPAVAMAESLGIAIDAVSARVSECVAAKAAPAELCFCRYPTEFNALRMRYAEAISKFPSWRSRTVSWTASGPMSNRSISMVGLERQLQQACPK